MNQSIGAYGEAQGKYGQSALSLAATAQVGAVILALQLCVMAVHRYIRNETVSMTRYMINGVCLCANGGSYWQVVRANQSIFP